MNQILESQQTPHSSTVRVYWGVYCEDFGENWWHYNGTALALHCICQCPPTVDSPPCCVDVAGASYLLLPRVASWTPASQYHPNLQVRPPTPGPGFSTNMSSYRHRKSHCGDKTVVRSSYLHIGISYTGKMASLYWTNPQNKMADCLHPTFHSLKNVFTPQPKLGSRGIVVACRAGGRYLTPLPLSRAQFWSDRGQTWWGWFLGQDLGRVCSW